MRNNKGITLVSLIASILLILIIAATTIATSMNAYNQMKFEGAKSELEEVQKLVDEIAADYQTYLKEQGTAKEYTDYFEDRYNASKTDFESKLLSNHSGDIQILVDKYTDISNAISNSSTTAFYFTEDDLVKYFNLKGIDPVVVDFSIRSVYSVEGIKDPENKEQIYYTPSEWGSNSVVAKSEDTSITSAVTVTKVATSENSTSIDIKIIVNPKLRNNISEVYYNKDGNFVKIDNFREIANTRETEIRATVPSNGSYIFKVVDELKNSYESQATTISAN